jgi:hypothetical protein
MAVVLDDEAVLSRKQRVFGWFARGAADISVKSCPSAEKEPCQCENARA